MLHQGKKFTTEALAILKNKYLLRNPNTLEVIEKVEDFFPRIARGIADVDQKFGKNEQEIDITYQRFLNAMQEHRIIPAGRNLANIGAGTKVVPNCVVLDIKDSLDDIGETMKRLGMLQKAGCGIGYPFHKLRPTGEIVKESRSQSSGPISFLKVFNEWIRTIKQQGRHGANMATFRIDHPDILEFIDSKQIEGNINCFNISTLITDEFMQIASDPNHPKFNEPWKCHFDGKEFNPRIIHRTYDYGIMSYRIEETQLTPNDIFNKIVQRTHQNGEPGCLFYDEINRKNPLKSLFSIEATNPCGEQDIPPNDVCLLITIMLNTYINEDKSFNTELFKEDLRMAVHMGDNIIELYDIPDKLISQTVNNNRRIGINFAGFADMLLMLNIRYGSDECIDFIHQIMTIWKETLVQKSRELAIERGCFPNWEHSVFFQNGEPPRRNVALSCAAPTGTVSRLVNVSSGIEPVFMFFTQSNIMNSTFLSFHQLLKQKLAELNLFNKEIIQQIVYDNGSIQNIEQIPEDIKRVFVCAMDISPEDHIRVQATFQQYLENAISKTINYPESASLDDIKKGYILAWKMGCRGFTAYRNNSRVKQVIESVNLDHVEDFNQIDSIKVKINKKFESVTADTSSPKEVKSIRDKSQSFRDIILTHFERYDQNQINRSELIQSIIDSEDFDSSFSEDLHTTPVSSSSDMPENEIPNDSNNEFFKEAETSNQINNNHPVPTSSPRKKIFCLMCRSENIQFSENCRRCLDCDWSPCSI